MSSLDRVSAIPSGNRKRPLALLMIIFVFLLPLESPGLSVDEVLSVATGYGPGNIGNQFSGGQNGSFERTYAGFTVGSGRTIFIGDILNSRILQFAGDRTLPRSIAPKSPPALAQFWPTLICSNKDRSLFVYESSQAQIVSFSEDGNLIANHPLTKNSDVDPKASIRVLDMVCGTDSLLLTYEIHLHYSRLWPVYSDTYDYNFKLLNRISFENEAAYLKSKTSGPYVRLFSDKYGNRYSVPIEAAWGLDFLPLSKISERGMLLYTVDGSFLTKATKYTIHDYYGMKKRGGWGNMRGREFLIMNWYVEDDGTIYALIANNDYLKVLRVKD